MIISSLWEEWGLDFEKVDGCPLIDKEDKGEKVHLLKGGNGVLRGDS